MATKLNSKIPVFGLNYKLVLWVSKLNRLSDAEYVSKQYTKWPLIDRSFLDTALWLNGELMKNAAEIGYGRFLYKPCEK
ncbi:hypothetical protein [Lacrimispora sp.]|uniref:hypothetical protein n=1 Tax=Lacrimispora sp. TaxID=2719234 RepID=UPI0039E507D9